MGANTLRVGALDPLRRLVQALRTSSALAERTTGLSGAQLFVLRELGGLPGASINDLAARTLTHQSSVSLVVARLVRAGLVRRGAHQADRRRVALALTAKGARVLRRAPGTFQERLLGALSRLSKAEVQQLAGGLRALERELGLAGAQPALFFERRPRAEGPPREAAGQVP